MTFSIPASKETGFRAFARGANGTVVAAGWTSSEDGKTAEILAIASSAGALNLVRVDPFATRQLAVAPDGTIWAQGYMGRNRDNIVDIDPQHGVLRHFDASGNLLGSFYPQSRLDNRLRTSKGFLAAAKDRVGWISLVESSAAVKSMGYVEVEANGSVKEFPLPALETIKGLAFTSSGAPLAHIVVARGAGPKVPESSAIMMLDRNSSTWSAVEAPDHSTMAGKQLLGATEDSIAIWDVRAQRVSFFRY